MKAQNEAISEIRAFNRFYTGILGLLDRTLLKSPYSLTEVRVLYEIGQIRNCTANLLMENLHIDRGYLSRMLKNFQTEGLIQKESHAEDARKSLLSLTPAGKKLLADMDAKSNVQVSDLIQGLSSEDVESLLVSMRQIKNALGKSTDEISVRTYKPKDIDYVIRRHIEIYEEEYGFNSLFGEYVDEHVRQEFGPKNTSMRKNLWIAEYNGRPAGMIAVAEIDEETAQLRYFLIDKEVRGKGLGHRLMRAAVDFCSEQGYKRCFLYTVSILGAARHLYGAYGFTLAESAPNGEWREDLIEERWEMTL